MAERDLITLIKQTKRELSGAISSLDSKIDSVDRKYGVLFEKQQDTMKLLGEGFQMLSDKMDRNHAELKTEIGEVKQGYTPISVHLALDKRVTKLESR
ncbi:hypothetical protein EXS54_02950 [Patescibacteria group bacterium]|nr:hypothetical protein [Patescibacteria group bacterium]